MKLNVIGSNQTELVFDSGARVLFSYETPVAAFVPCRGFVRTDRSFSQTTSRHINAYCTGRTVETVPHADIVRLSEGKKIGPDKIEWTRINNDTNGNPRYVCHFLSLLTDAEKESRDNAPFKYTMALARAKSIGGRKFHNKQYGGGIVFQSYSLDETEAAISAAIDAASKAQGE